MCFFNENECSKNFYSDTKFVYNNYLKSLSASGGSIFFFDQAENFVYLKFLLIRNL